MIVRGDVNKTPPHRRHNEIEKWRYTNAERRTLSQPSGQPRHRERRNLTADSKAINHKAINVTPWDGYATVIAYTRDLYNPGSDVSLSSFVLQSRAEDLYARPTRICSRIVMTKQFVLSLGESLVLLNTSHELEYFQRHNDKTLRRRKLAAA